MTNFDALVNAFRKADIFGISNDGGFQGMLLSPVRSFVSGIVIDYNDFFGDIIAILLDGVQERDNGVL